MLNAKKQDSPVAVVNQFASRGLRDVADRDYLAARAAFRAGIDLPVLTSGHQALEKYLKAILLYNGLSAKNLGHDIAKAFDRVVAISDINFDFPDDIRPTVEYFDDHGRSRYFEYSYHFRERICLMLDRTVWHIRRYCFYMRGTLNSGKDLLPIQLQRVQGDVVLEKPHEFRLFNGFLESVLDKDTHKGMRDVLVWKNFYYGARKKNVLKNYSLRSSMANSPLSMHPDDYDILKDLIDFSSEIHKEMKARSAKGVS